jgi:hypothetical protein
MSKMKDLTGQEFDRLRVIRFSFIKNGRAMWECVCVCGTVKVVNGQALRSGGTRSCGCLHDESASKPRKHGLAKRGEKIPEYGIWKGARKRCNNPNDKRYADYGGRGIQMHHDWDDFSRFFADMGPRPSPKHTLDRIDNNGHYEPGNCRWATKRDQANNRRSTPLLEFNGETMSLAQWARRVGLPAHILNGRKRLGWPMEKILYTPIKK